MSQLFENKNNLFSSGNSLGKVSISDTLKRYFPVAVGQNIRVGDHVVLRRPIWGYNRDTRKNVIERYETIQGEVIKLPKNPTGRSFVELRTSPRTTRKITLETFHYGDAHRRELAGTDNDSDNEMRFVKEIASDLFYGKKHDKRLVSVIAKKNGIEDETIIKELYETAVMRYLKEAYTFTDLQKDFELTVEAYSRQMSLNARSSNSLMLQQYSTPAPIAYLAGTYVKNNQPKNAYFFEPSAGNGLLTLALPEKNTIVNEIDKNRLHNLAKFHQYEDITSRDASKSIRVIKIYDGIITNPPFGKAETREFSGYKIGKLDFQMAIHALNVMTDKGRAAIIVGGHTEWDTYGRVAVGQNRIFLSYLHHFYNVEDVINIDGKLYGKQGTTFPIRLILINGRKAKPEGTAPLKTDYDKTVKSFDELYKRVSSLLSGSETDRIARELMMLLESENEIGVGGTSNVPRGKSQKEIKEREKIIIQFFRQWEKENPEKRIFNKNLNDYIYVNSVGKHETTHQAARSYKSTVFLLNMSLSELLKKATLIKRDEPHSKRQDNFSEMPIMEWKNIKLTVGVTKTEKKKIQYCISAIK